MGQAPEFKEDWDRAVKDGFIPGKTLFSIQEAAENRITSYNVCYTKLLRAFFPSGDRNQYLIYLDLPAGTRIEETDRTVRKLSAWLQDKEQNPEITGTIAYVGNGGPRFFLSLAPVDP